MAKVIITPDHVLRDFRLCWRIKDSQRGWGSTITKKITAKRMESLVRFLNAQSELLEYWMEELDG